jgi:hypothetical protein
VEKGIFVDFWVRVMYMNGFLVMGSEEFEFLGLFMVIFEFLEGGILIFGFGRNVMIFGVKMCFWKVCDMWSEFLLMGVDGSWVLGSNEGILLCKNGVFVGLEVRKKILRGTHH